MFTMVIFFFLSFKRNSGPSRNFLRRRWTQNWIAIGTKLTAVKSQRDANFCSMAGCQQDTRNNARLLVSQIHFGICVNSAPWKHKSLIIENFQPAGRRWSRVRHRRRPLFPWPAEMEMQDTRRVLCLWGGSSLKVLPGVCAPKRGAESKRAFFSAVFKIHLRQSAAQVCFDQVIFAFKRTRAATCCDDSLTVRQNLSKKNSTDKLFFQPLPGQLVNQHTSISTRIHLFKLIKCQSWDI